MSYGSLHIHDEYSNISTGLDSINKLDNLIQYAKDINLSGIAITNHDNLSDIWNINKAQKKLRAEGHQLKVIQGNEIYLLPEWKDDDSIKYQYWHFILIPKDKIGFDAMLKISSAAWYRSKILRGKRRIPTLYSDLEEFITPEVKGHIIGCSACLGGYAAKMFLNKKDKEAYQFLNWCESIFGAEDFYLELQSNDIADQKIWNNKIKELSDRYQTIITTDAHYCTKDELPMLEAFLRSSNESRKVNEFYSGCYLQTEEEIRNYLSYLPKDLIDKSLNNTNRIVSQVEFFDLAQKFHIPKVEVPRMVYNGPSTSGYTVISEMLASQDIQTNYCIVTCLNKLIELDKWNKVYLDRLEHEVDVFKFQSEELKDNFYCYFNTLRHYLDMAWDVDCAVGPSRGSSSGSLICYLMDIVQCDPIQYGLVFWRFAHKFRTSILDIDIDLSPVHKPRLLKEIRKERGELGITQVATFKTLTLKAAIGNAGKGYRTKNFPQGLNSDIIAYLSSLIEVKRGFVASLKQTLEGDDIRGFKVNNMFIKEVKAYPGLLEIIKKFEGLITNSSTHAAAVVFFDLEIDPITNHCSLMRSPNGDLCTALDLNSIEEVGTIKYDFLVLSTLATMTKTFQLLQQYNIIDKQLSLKECYRTYIDPNKIDFTNPLIWEKLYNNEILSVFQWNEASGRKGVLAARPNNLEDLTVLNAMIRLQAEEGEEDQISRFCRIKNDPSLFEQEMIDIGLSEEIRLIMHEELDQYNGCCAMQESFMILLQKIANYSLGEADTVRKIVAKKKLNEIEKLKETFYSRCPGTKREKDYLYSTILAPSLGYGFNKLHSHPYSIVGVQCILLGGILFPSIFWQTAYLLQQAGSLDDKSANYNKIAKAVSQLYNQKVEIKTIDINKSERDFTLDLENNCIYYGLEGMKGLRSTTIDSILAARPFDSIYDFVVRANPEITSIVSLIKAGAFDKMHNRVEAIEIVAKLKSKQKDKLNGQNFAMISRKGYWPQSSDELKYAQKIFNFTQYLKKLPNGILLSQGISFDEITSLYPLDERACVFLDSIGIEHNGQYISKKTWKAIYNLALKPMKQYLIDNQEDILDRVNKDVIEEWKNTYFPNNEYAIGEIETMGLTFQPHPMVNIQNVVDFNILPQEPQIDFTFKTKEGRTIPMMKLDMICGYAIAKDKLHHTVTILTNTGPVDVKYRREQFSIYDQQVSQYTNGKKKVIEKSWFNRGTPLLIHGMRNDDLFLAKIYKKSPMQHTTYKITNILPNGKLEVQRERMKGVAEEVNEE